MWTAVLILGVALWWAAHFFKRVAPDRRAAMGDKGRGPVALVLLVSVVLMVIGYRGAEGTFFWPRTPMLAGINNLLVLVAFYLFAADGMKTRVTRLIRHPQLTGFALWALGHVIVNGDTSSFILFGGLLAWALAEIVVLNRVLPPWQRPAPGPMRKEAMAAAGAVIVFGVVALIHIWLGYNPFG